MATLGNTELTLAEILRREDPKGQLRDITDVISKVNQFQDSTWIECNNGTYHEDGRLVSKPAGSLRIYGTGVSGESAITEVITEPTQMLAGLSKVDAKKIEHSANPAGLRAQEDGFFISGMWETHLAHIFTGNRATNPIQINGINNRADYNTLSSDYVYDNAGGNASATANKTSIYIVQWGAKKVNLTYPRNDSPAGGSMPIKVEDYSKDLETDPNASTKQLPMYRTWFEVNNGLFIHDPRCIKRIVNISTSNIDGVDDFSFDEEVLIDAYNDMEYGGEGAVIYCNRTVKAQIMKRANVKGNAYYATQMEGEGPFARPVTRFWGIPVRELSTTTIPNTGAQIT